MIRTIQGLEVIEMTRTGDFVNELPVIAIKAKNKGGEISEHVISIRDLRADGGLAELRKALP